MTQAQPLDDRLGSAKKWLGILLPISIFLIFVILFPCWILEDGFIMLRYARNLAYGFGVVFNPGDTPVWGCTSMLTTVILAGMIRMGLTPEVASQALGVTTGISLIIVVYTIERSVLKLENFLAITSCSILAMSQAVALSLMGFDAVMFTLMMTLVFGVSLWGVLRPNPTSSWVPLYVLSLVCILLSLTRPEGALVSVATVFIVMWLRKDISRPQYFLRVILPYVGVMTIFYGWVWLYFGWLLPNPFYVKTGNLLIYPSAFYVLGVFAFHYIFPIIVVCLWILIIDRKPYRSFFFLTLPPILYLIAYFAINQIQNIELRYQFPILPILLIYFAQAIAFFKPHHFQQIASKVAFSRKKLTHIAILVMFIAALVQPAVTRIFTLPWGELPDALYTGQTLHDYQNNGYTMVVSEAGGIPFYADWHTVDAFGLNDPYIAHYGLTNEYLTALNPEVIMFNHPQYTEYNVEWATSTDPWDAMCRTLYLYATNNNYTLACIYRVYLRMDGWVYPYGNHWYYVRTNFTDSAAIINDLRSLDILDYIFPASLVFTTFFELV
ncbi:MAG: hypothetical protein ACFFD8_03825 [Candidatus Thorarchaeota archaeon]